MSIELLTIALIVSLLVFLFLGLPVAFSLIGVTTVFYLILRGPTALYLLFSVTFKTSITDVYIAAPLFCFMACVLEFSGLGTAMYDMMHKWMAGLRGGLAMGTVLISTILAAMTGLSATAVVMMGVLALPEMLKRGYNKNMAVGCIPFGGALGPLIPPSLLAIILGAFASLSIGKLFMGGIFPGLLASFLACVYIGVRSFRRPELAPALPPDERATWKEKFVSLRVVLPTIILIILVLGSIYTGVCTPTEAGGLGAIGAIICAIIYRNLTWTNIKSALLVTLRIFCMVLWLMIGGGFFASLMSSSGITHFIGSALIGMPLSTMGLVAVMMLIGLIMGMLMDYVSIIMITIPIFMPVVIELGVDPIWFALLFCINMIIGLITPPFGINLFYMKGLVPPGINLADIYRSTLPYVIILLIVLSLCFVFPEILTWLPDRMG